VTTAVPSPALILIDAATLLAENGWTQGKMRDHHTGAFCAYGALDHATENLEVQLTGTEFDDAYSLFADYLNENVPIGVDESDVLEIFSWDGQVSTWNDKVAESSDQVIAFMLAVAEQLEGVAA
jgi:hypothetical protein